MVKNRKTFNKLVRDKIPELLRANGGDPETTAVHGEEYYEKLTEKLFEECNEVITAHSQNQLAEELADLLEVMMSVAKYKKINFEDIEKIRAAKKEKRGGFDSGFFLKSTKIVENI